MLVSARSTPPTVALATSADLPDLAPDDRLLILALARLDVRAEPAIWTELPGQWERFDLIVVRSCWDYHDDLPRWLAFIGEIQRRGLGDRLRNPPAALVWNSRKTYLRDLAGRGVPIVPTRWFDAGDLGSWEDLRAALESTGWSDVVCKPAVSAGALGTFRWRREGSPEVSTPEAVSTAMLSRLISRGPVMVQPFIEEIAGAGAGWGASWGEWSLMYFAGRFSHAVRKWPARGDFRVQEEHGGSVAAADASPGLLALAEQTLTAAQQAITPEPPADPRWDSGAGFLYARVDVVVSRGRPLLMELELIEPALFFGNGDRAPLDTTGSGLAHPGPADLLARGIVDRLSVGQDRPSSPIGS